MARLSLSRHAKRRKRMVLRRAKRKRNNNEIVEPISAETITSAAMLLGDSIEEVGRELSRRIGADMIILQRAKELYGALGEIEGLTEDERPLL